jgi:tetratricopeptide (TPR) repeat protein
MAFLRSLLDDPFLLILWLFSAPSVLAALQLVAVAWRSRARLRENPLQSWQKRLVDRAAFLVAIPPGVVVHEFGHAVATWLFGGRIVDFGYGFYWGYVAPEGTFTAAQYWLISLAGTLGTLVYALALWLLLRGRRSDALRYFGIRALRTHLYYGLIYYPIFSALSFIGDWRTIYNFRATPLLSGATAVIHLGLLGAFLWADRRGRFEMRAMASLAAQRKMSVLEAEAAANPQDERLQLQRIQAIAQGGANNEATHHLRAFLRQYPRSAEGYLLMALLQSQGRERLPRSAGESAQKALALGLAQPVDVARAHQIIGWHNLDMERPEAAVEHFNRALERMDKIDSPLLAGLLYYDRARAQRRLAHYKAAYQDVQQAISLARLAGQEDHLAIFERERETIERHAGRSLGPSQAGAS